MSAKHAAAGSHASRSNYTNRQTSYRPPSSGRTPRRPREKHTARNVIIVILIVIAIIAICAVSFVASARAALGDAMTLQSSMSTFQSQMKDSSNDDLKSTVQTMGTAASDMHSQTSGPVWKIATIIPVYGSDVQRVIDLASVSDDLVNGALVPLTEKSVSFSLSGFITKDGSINVKKVQPAVEALAQANAAVQRSNNTISAMTESDNITQLNKPIQTLKGILPELATATNVANELSPVIDDLLGTKSTRTYLLVAQNNVEMRSVGGFPGSMGPVTVKNGKVTLGEFKSVYKWIPRLKQSNAVSITDEERKIFSKRMGYIPGDVGQIPDFSRVGAIWNAQWEKSNSNKIDGIIAMDPVFLQNMLKLTGGFTASNNWKVNGDNAAQVLMNRSYLEMPIDQTDSFFAEVAGQAFGKVKSNLGSIDPTKLVDTLKDGIQQHRLNIWMKDDKEEAALQNLGYAGELSSDITNPVLGVYTSDYTWSKIGWYLDEDTTVSKATNNLDGSKTYDVTVTLKNAMTSQQRDAINQADESAQDYIYGNNKNKRSDTDMIYFLYLVAPSGGTISDVKTSGYFGPYSTVNVSSPLNGKKNDRTMAQTTYNGHQLWGGETQIEQGKETTVSFKVTTAAGTSVDLQVNSTPSANPDLDWKVTYGK